MELHNWSLEPCLACNFIQERKELIIIGAKDTLSLISKQWCDLNDLMKLTHVGRNNALKIRQNIKGELLKKGYVIPNNLLPMNEVVDYLKINISYLKKVSE